MMNECEIVVRVLKCGKLFVPSRDIELLEFYNQYCKKRYC